jgi:outer membrane protein TolC
MKLWVIIGAALIAWSQSAFSQTISMEAYLADVQARHPFFVKEAMEEDIAAQERERYLGDKDWVVESSAFLTYRKPVVATTFTPNRIYTLDVGANIGRTYWGNGSRLSFSWRSNWLDQEVPGIFIPSPTGNIAIPVGESTFFENRLFATYSYPLLQNRGGVLDRLEYELSDFDIDFAEIQALENQENFLFGIGTRYLEWVLIHEERRIAEERLHFQEEQLEQTKRKRRANLVDEVDVLRGEDAVMRASESLFFVESRLKAKRAELAVLAQNDSLYTLDPDKDLFALDVIPTIDEMVGQIGNQRLVRTLRVRVRQLERQRLSLENIVRPELFLSLRAGVQEGNTNFAKAWALDKPDLTLMLDFRYPLGAKTAKADVATTTLRVHQLEREIETISLNLEAELRSLWIKVQELEKILVLNQQEIETARKKTDEERNIYNQGRGDMTFVIQSRDREALAQLTYAVNAASYHQLVLAYRALVDDLLPGD